MYPGTHAQHSPDKPAIVMAGSGQVVTYAELDNRSLRLANVLRAAGLQRGDVVALLADNDPRVFTVYWAAQRAGLYLTAINPRLQADELAYILGNCGARALFVGTADAAPAVPGLPDSALRVSFEPGVPGFQPLQPLLDAASTQRPEREPRGGDMLYSSGTTGRPKGVRPPLPERAVHEPGDTLVGLFGKLFGFSADTVYLSPAPLYHAAPLRTCATVHALGGTAVVMERFEPEPALAAIARWKVTHSQWVPTMFVRMLKLPPPARTRHALGSLQVAIHAAAPCPVDVKQAMLDWWGPVLHEYYSCTEVNGMTVMAPHEVAQKPGSVGRSVLGTLRICNEAGELLPTGQDGWVYFERDELPFAYHGDADKTRATQHPQHPTWTTVGDIGHVDADGYLYLTDRQAFMIISGGVNIYPQEVENALALHPAIADVAVFGVPDAEMGERVLAVVTLMPGASAGAALAQDIIAFARSRVAAYKAPRSVDFVDALPRTPTGKMQKGPLRARYWNTDLCDIGLVGLGVMGRNLALNMADHGLRVAVHDHAPEAVARAAASHPSLQGQATLAHMVAALAPPRRVMLMVNAGAPVDEVLTRLVPLLAPGDIVVDGGNSRYTHTERRCAELAARGLHFVGAGVSGGEEGARKGPALMPGGAPEGWRALQPVFEAIAARVDGQPCAVHVGPGGAGHYVKMVHNGIEYGDMQLICEAYALLAAAGLDANAMAAVFGQWNAGPLQSYLIEITAVILAERDADTGRPLVDLILDRAGQKGTGQWALVSAAENAVVASVMAAAVDARVLSSHKPLRVQASTQLPGPGPAVAHTAQAWVALLHDALYASKIVSYAQGFELMRSMGAERGWALDLGAIARIWRGGCIIRAQFLNRIADAYADGTAPEHLMLAPYFQQALARCQAAWREVVASAVRAGVPVPAMAAALAYYDSLRSARLPANLLQAQRDFFGAHTYERVDKPAGQTFHTRWPEVQG